MRNVRVAALLWLTVSIAAEGVTAQAIETSGEIEAVTVYRGQALVTRRVPIDAGEGLREVVITSLPEFVVGPSLYAEGGEGVAIRSIRFRERAVEADVRENVRSLDAQIEEASDRVRSVERQAQVVQQQRQYLDRLEQFTAGTANVELTRGVLNADTLTTLTEFQFEKRASLAERELSLERDLREAREQLSLLQRQRAELAQSSATTVREAVVFVELEPGGDRELSVRYLVEAASWSPSYNIRAEADADAVNVEYAALVTQMSGEDWNDVAMTLSTATPSLAAEAPELEPLTVALTSGGAQQAQLGLDAYVQGKVENEAAQRRLERRRAQASESQDAAGADLFGGATDEVRGPGSAGWQSFDRQLNEFASNIQLLEIQAAPETSAAAGPAVEEQSVSVTYRIPERTSLPSRADQQLIAIAALPMEGEFYRLAVPVLTPHVYRQAEVRNTGEVVLLAGPVSSYLGGQFVGRGAIPTVAVGERFTVGFGIDASLRGERRLLDKTDETHGGNRLQGFRYRLSVANFGDEAATVRVRDRIPTETDGQVDVTLVETSQPRIDAEDERELATTGLMEWRVEAPADATGARAAGVEYRYTLAFDKQLTITGLPVRR